jgi:hypothetical protein
VQAGIPSEERHGMVFIKALIGEIRLGLFLQRVDIKEV